ncbi:MAG: glutathione S-transferase family protein [Betaproteobacteria bacterium]|nr:glutathione S-transferase family protein [Betaproteobacteria bacterium]
MKLFVNQTSPYARKARIVVKEKSLDTSVLLVDVDPWLDPVALLSVSPLSKVPVLVTDDDLVVTESDTICRILDDLAPATRMLPEAAAARHEVMSRMALLQGMIDAAFDAVIEKRRPAAQQWPDWVSRQRRAVERGLAVVAAMPRPAGRFDLGDVSLGSLLGYLDFRHQDMDWRATHPALADWYASVAVRPSMQATRPDAPVV